ncbi:MAG: TetR/AcrR family transcriptional regulator [Deltaproteobacteria bacterium]|nr:TetR/AcrR family transcriptional regulator [Deltaproteobacteria bacterium]
MFIFNSQNKEDPNLPRREREKVRQRQEMLAAALELFSEKGYHNVSMNEIAQKSEFAVGTLYKFFKNKEDLYKTLMLELAGRFQSELEGALEAKDDEIEKLQNWVTVGGEIFRANLAAIRLFLAETQGLNFNLEGKFESEVREIHEKTIEKLTAVFAAGIQKHRFNRIADPVLLAVALDSITKAALFLWMDSPEQHPYPPENPDVILNILFEGLVAPIDRSRP